MIILLSLLWFSRSSAQVTFIIDDLPDYTPPADTLFIAGNMTNWEPGAPGFALVKNEEQKWSITLSAQTPGTEIQFKFTRGSWETVEKGPLGEEIPNRSFTYGNGDTVSVIIHNWRDHGGGAGSTAAENVHILDGNFYMPQLDRERNIWIYLPPDYESSGKNYPVLYMHDGQNLFDNLTSFAGEWEIDETLNALAGQGYQVPIVVGIDNGGSYRIEEYSPWQHPQHGGGKGEQYMAFIVETLKPFVDQNYRTLPGREFAGIMGSSLGGLISHFGAVEYQEVFGKAGIFSPSYWFSDSVWQFTTGTGMEESMRFYLMCGGQEGSTTLTNLQKMRDTLTIIGFPEEDVFSTIIPGGQHNEALWRNQFGEAYLWLFASYASDIHEEFNKQGIVAYPNPVAKYLELSNIPAEKLDSVIIYNMAGQAVLTNPDITNSRIDVTALPTGLYILHLSTQTKTTRIKFIKE